MAHFDPHALEREEYKSFMTSEYGSTLTEMMSRKRMMIDSSFHRDGDAYINYIGTNVMSEKAPAGPGLFEDFGSYMRREGGMHYSWISALLDDDDDSCSSLQPTNDEDFVSYFARSNGIVDSATIDQLRDYLTTDTQLHLPSVPPPPSATLSNNALTHIPQHRAFKEEEEEEDDDEEEEEHEEEEDQKSGMLSLQ